MLTLILGVLLVSIILSIILRSVGHRKGYRSNLYELRETFKAIEIICTSFAFIILIPFCTLLSNISTGKVIDEKIAMYEEENAAIEKDIDRIVSDYMEFEQDTFKNIGENESPITLVTLFPELKSDSLVQQQIEIYTKNNKAIRGLKEDKINLSKKRWWITFTTH